MAKKQLMMMAVDLVNHLSKKSDLFEETLGKKVYSNLLTSLMEILRLKVEVDCDWPFLEKGFKVIRNAKDKIGENTLKEVKEVKEVKEGMADFLFGEQDGEIVLILPHDGQNYDVKSIDVIPTTKEGIFDVTITHASEVEMSLKNVPNDVINKLAGRKIPVMSINSAEGNITNINIVRMEVC